MTIHSPNIPSVDMLRGETIAQSECAGVPESERVCKMTAISFVLSVGPERGFRNTKRAFVKTHVPARACWMRASPRAGCMPARCTRVLKECMQRAGRVVLHVGCVPARCVLRAGPLRSRVVLRPLGLWTCARGGPVQSSQKVIERRWREGHMHKK